MATLAFYVLKQGSIDENYSSGYKGIWIFFTIQTVVQVLFQSGLIFSDIKGNKMLGVSLRSGAFFLVLGMTVILAFIGLFSIYLILFFVVVEALHLTLFDRALKMEDDQRREWIEELEERRAPREEAVSSQYMVGRSE